MDARPYRAALVAVLVCLASSTLAARTQAASHRTRFFVVTAPSVDLARQVGEAAEQYRRQLAEEWLGYELPEWSDVCPIYVTPKGGAGGETRFVFMHGQPREWRMIVQGSPERILDSVLPHEVLHMVFATHFKQGLPRWADEGACTTVEHQSERGKQERLLYQCLTTDRGIAFNQMFAMREYPKDMLPLYAQGYSVARFLIAVGGKRKFVDYVGEGLKTNNWTAATNRAYGFNSLSQLQVNWLEWVRQGGREELAANFFVQPDAAATPPAAQVAVRAAEPARQVAADGTSQVAALATPEPLRLSPVPKTTDRDTSLATTSPTRPASGPGTSRTLDSAAAPHRPHTAVAGTANGGWYARQRDAHRTTGGAAGQTASTARPSDRAVSRPQPVEQAREVVIEWNGPAPYAPGSTGTRTLR